MHYYTRLLLFRQQISVISLYGNPIARYNPNQGMKKRACALFLIRFICALIMDVNHPRNTDS